MVQKRHQSAIAAYCMAVMCAIGVQGTWAQASSQTGPRESGRRGNSQRKDPVRAPALSAPRVKPAVQKPAVQKPAVQKPAVQKPAMQKPAVQKPAVQKPAMYKMLANMQGVADDPEKVNRFKILLQELDEKYVENDQTIGGMTIHAHYKLKHHGVQAAFLTILEAMNQIASPGQRGLRYLDSSALYVAARTKGRSHEQAIADVRAGVPAPAQPESSKTTAN